MSTETGRPLLIGATAADTKRAVLIWNANRKYFHEQGLPVEYALYSTYDALCSHLLAGHVDIAWNAPMAHAQSLLADVGCRTLAMRDTDEDVHTLLVARSDSGLQTLTDLSGRRVALGLDTSSELWLIPVAQMAADGLDPRTDCDLVELMPRTYPNLQEWIDDPTIFDAVVDGHADAGVIFEPWLPALTRRRGIEADDITVLWRSRPYSHCAFTSRPGLDRATSDRFVELLLAMDPDDEEIAEMMRMEHLSKWVLAGDDGWRDLMDAVEGAGLTGRTF